MQGWAAARLHLLQVSSASGDGGDLESWGGLAGPCRVWVPEGTHAQPGPGQRVSWTDLPAPPPPPPTPSQPRTWQGPTLPLSPQLGSWRLRPLQHLLRDRPAGAGGALRAGPGPPPEDAAPCPVRSAGPEARGGGNLQLPALPPQVSAGWGRFSPPGLVPALCPAPLNAPFPWPLAGRCHPGDGQGRPRPRSASSRFPAQETCTHFSLSLWGPAQGGAVRPKRGRERKAINATSCHCGRCHLQAGSYLSL